jgi:hypothetical protein
MVRNFGSAVHISLTVTVSLRMADTAYGELAERIMPFNAPEPPRPAYHRSLVVRQVPESVFIASQGVFFGLERDFCGWYSSDGG